MPQAALKLLHTQLQKAFEEIGRKFPNATAAERLDLFAEARRLMAQMEFLLDERRARYDATLHNLL